MQLVVNSCSFTGRVEDIRAIGDEKFILLKSMVSGKMQTNYPVVIKNSDYDKLDPFIPGTYLSVLNVPLGIENGRYRFRVADSSQVWRIKPRSGQSFSQATFSGLVAGIDEEEESFILHIVQENKLRKAEFLLVLGKKLYPQISVTFEDEVLVSNAQAYQKDGIFRFRILSRSQLKLIKRNNPDKGIVQARDKFI